jgi:hypothetical protein
MEKERLYIYMPDDAEIQQQINLIVENGLKKEESFFEYLKNMYNQVGTKYLFHDASEILFVISLFLTLLILAIIDKSFWNNEFFKTKELYAFIMAISPILYLTVSSISFISSKGSGTYQIEMTCKYNLYQIQTFRMLIFSILTILVNVVFIGVVVSLYEKIDFFRAFMISTSSLFIFSIILLYTIMNLHSKIIKHLVIIGWLALNIALWILNLRFYTKLLIDIPIPLYAIVVAVCMYVYVKKLKELTRFRKVEGVF